MKIKVHVAMNTLLAEVGVYYIGRHLLLEIVILE